jgi:hypothetical protein
MNNQSGFLYFTLKAVSDEVGSSEMTEDTSGFSPRSRSSDGKSSFLSENR